MGDRVVLPPQPLAHIVTAISTAATYVTARHLLGWPAGVAAALAVVAAPIVALKWPRFATDTLRLHGTVLPGVPGDGDGWLLGRAPELARAMAAKRTCFLMTAWRSAAGSANYQVWLGGKRRVFLSNPSDIAHVLGRVAPPRDMRWMRAFGLPISPKVIILSAGAEHVAARRLLAGPLADGRVLGGAAAGVVADVCGEGDDPIGGALAAAADNGTPADVAEAAEEITLRAMHRTMVSSPATPGVNFGPALRELFPLLLPLMLVPAPGVFAPRRLARIRALGDRFRQYMVLHEAARRAAYAAGTWPRSPPRDILDVLLSDSDGGGVYAGDRDRLAADFMALLVAGVDTTAHSLQWGIYLLCTHPDIQARVFEEVSTVLPPALSEGANGLLPRPVKAEAPLSSPPPSPALDARTFTSLPYLNAVWKETLRLYPPAASGVSRRLATDVTLPSCGAVLPAGTSIKMPHHMTFRSPQNYPHPETFDPDRWITPVNGANGHSTRGGGGQGGCGGGSNKGSAKGLGENAWRPFGMGPGSCMGRDLAEVEWKAAVAALVTKYEVSLAGPASGVKEIDAITLRPSQMLVRLRRRVTESAAA
ncbi:hypothetical protein MMPV_004741 [Pyropia vietnamensis]